MIQESWPWFGRGNRLPALPYRVVVGPVDASYGISGLTEIGMSKQVVQKSLGHPLVKGLTAKDTERRGFIDPEDVAAEFYDGIFAWVRYGEKNRVISITFDLLAFAQKLRGDQRVLLQYRGATYLLHKDLSQGDVVAMLRDKSAASDIQLQGSEVVIRGTGTSLTFSESTGKLRSVTIIAL